MDIKFKIGGAFAKLGKKKRFSFVSRHPLATYYRYRIDYQRQANLPAVCEYFAVRPSSSVDVQSLRLQLIESRIALQSIRNSLASLDARKSTIPKIIWMYWDKGLESAPEVVKLSRLSWETQNPDWDVRFLDDSTIIQYLDVQSTSLISSELFCLHCTVAFGPTAPPSAGVRLVRGFSKTLGALGSLCSGSQRQQAIVR
jgi:hypothetical protein